MSTADDFADWMTEMESDLKKTRARLDDVEKCNGVHRNNIQSLMLLVAELRAQPMIEKAKSLSSVSVPVGQILDPAGYPDGHTTTVNKLNIDEAVHDTYLMIAAWVDGLGRNPNYLDPSRIAKGIREGKWKKP